LSTSKISALLVFIGLLGVFAAVMFAKSSPTLLDASLVCIAGGALLYFVNIILGLWREAHQS
jgi:hypothetical protein